MRNRQYKYFVSNPDLKIAQYLWNSVDLKFNSAFYNMNIPKLKVHKVIYVPKLIKNFKVVMNGKFKTNKHKFTQQESAGLYDEEKFDNETYVMVRLLSNRELKDEKSANMSSMIKFEKEAPRTSC